MAQSPILARPEQKFAFVTGRPAPLEPATARPSSPSSFDMNPSTPCSPLALPPFVWPCVFVAMQARKMQNPVDRSETSACLWMQSNLISAPPQSEDAIADWLPWSSIDAILSRVFEKILSSFAEACRSCLQQHPSFLRSRPSPSNCLHSRQLLETNSTSGLRCLSLPLLLPKTAGT